MHWLVHANPREMPGTEFCKYLYRYYRSITISRFLWNPLFFSFPLLGCNASIYVGTVFKRGRNTVESVRVGWASVPPHIMPKLKSHVAGLPVVYILKTSLFDIKLLFQFSRLPVVPSDLDAMVFSVGITVLHREQLSVTGSDRLFRRWPGGQGFADDLVLESGILHRYRCRTTAGVDTSDSPQNHCAMRAD